MTSELLPCCCSEGVLCPCFAFSGGYRITWTGVVRHDPVDCICLVPTHIPPNPFGTYEMFTIQEFFEGMIPSFVWNWVQPTTSNPSPCQLAGSNLLYPPLPQEYYTFNGICEGPFPFGTVRPFIGVTIQPYQPSLGRKWRVTLNPRPFRLVFESESTNCDPTDFNLISSTVDPFQNNGILQPWSLNCHREMSSAGFATVSSTLVSVGSLTMTRV